jgi:hypothetical protein
MSKIEQLIEAFRQEVTSELTNEDHSKKPGVVDALEEHAAESEVWEFLLHVAGDQAEFDLARIAALKVVEVAEGINVAQHEQAATLLSKILKSSDHEDEDVCNYAAIAAAYYLDFTPLYQEMVRIAVGAENDSGLRWNAFDGLERHGPRQTTIDVLVQLRDDDEFGTAASRVLSEWK